MGCDRPGGPALNAHDRLRPRRAPLLAGALALGIAACAEPPPPPVDAGPAARITALRVADATPAEARPVPLEPARLAEVLAGALTGAGLAVDPPDPLGIWGAWGEARERAGLPRGYWAVEVEGRAVYGRVGAAGIAPEVGPGELKAVWTIELALRPPDGAPTLYAFAGGESAAPFEGADAAALGPALAARVEAAAADAARQVQAQVETLGQDEAALIEAVGADDPLVRRAAAERLGMLRSPAAVPALSARVQVEEDRDAQLRMIGALAEIGDDRAAEALIALANPRDRELLRAVIDALSVVGGARVGDFFSILAHHDDADVRLLVEQARLRLEHHR